MCDKDDPFFYRRGSLSGGLEGNAGSYHKNVERDFRGYDLSQVPKITVFPNGVDGLSCDSVIADSGGFYSMCEHHMMPFFGKYWFAYIPNPKGKILGISKVGRVVDYCAARLQVQERLAKDIIVMIQEALGSEYPPLAMGIVLEGEHLCKSMRGVKKEGKMQFFFLFCKWKFT